jgi:predicted RND superfamily exporter protein
MDRLIYKVMFVPLSSNMMYDMLLKMDKEVQDYELWQDNNGNKEVRVVIDNENEKNSFLEEYREYFDDKEMLSATHNEIDFLIFYNA